MNNRLNILPKQAKFNWLRGRHIWNNRNAVQRIGWWHFWVCFDSRQTDFLQFWWCSEL